MMKKLLLNIRNKVFGINKIEFLLKENETNSRAELQEALTEVALLHKKIDDLFAENFPAKTHESFDVRFLARMEAGFSSARFFNTFLYDKKVFESDLDLLCEFVGDISETDLVLEFGVFSGRTINALADRLPKHKLWGFDSFEGLPETWRNDFVKGTFKVDTLPEVRKNVALVQGWFDVTLPKFLAENSGQVGLLHVDCDLYSSTKTVLNLLKSRFKNGSIIIFDEYFNYPGWEQHEYSAFSEFLSETGYKFEYLGCNVCHQQVAVKLIA